MNQDQLLERLWTDVIDAVDPAMSLHTRSKGAVERTDLQHVARRARYQAVFGWCAAFDEEGISVAEWLGRTERAWREWATFDPAALEVPPRAGRPDDPFADAIAAHGRLLAAGVSGAELASLLEHEAHAALAALRAVLREQSFEPGELAGLHESLLSADPSGREARPGSWPRRAEPSRLARPGERAPLLRVRHSHELALSSDGLRVVAARGGVITDVASGSALATCQLLANTSHVAWSPDDRWIAASSTSGAIALCDGETGARVRVLGRTREGPAPVFSEDGAVLYAGDWNGDIVAWEVATGRELARHHVAGVMVKGVERAPDGGLVVWVSHRPRPVELLFLSPALDERAPRVPLERFDDLALDPTGGGALVSGYGWVARLDLSTGARSDRHEIPARRVALSPDARWAAVTTASGFRVGPSADLAQGVEIPMQYASGRAAFSPDGRRIALATWNEGEVWELDALLSRPG